MRRRVVTRITLTMLLAGICLLIASFPFGGGGIHYYRMALGMTLGFLGMTFSLLMFWPEPGQSDVTSLVFMAVSTLPSWLVASGARWRIRWRQVAKCAWGSLLILSLTSVALALFGDYRDAIFLTLAVGMLNVIGSLIVGVARLPVSRRQA